MARTIADGAMLILGGDDEAPRVCLLRYCVTDGDLRGNPVMRTVEQNFDQPLSKLLEAALGKEQAEI